VNLKKLVNKRYPIAWAIVLVFALLFINVFDSISNKACKTYANHVVTDFCRQTDIFVTKVSPGNLSNYPVAVPIDLRAYVDGNTLSEFGWDILPVQGAEVPAMIQDIDPGDVESIFWIQGDLLGSEATVTFNVYTGNADFKRDQGILLHQASGADSLSVLADAVFNITDNIEVIVHADTDTPDQNGILLDKLNGNNGYQLEVTTTGAGSILATVGSGAATDTLEVAWTGDETIRMTFDAGAVNDLDISFLNAAGVWVSQGDTNTTFASLGTHGNDLLIGTGFDGVIQEVEIRDDVGLGSYAKVAQWSFDARDITETQTGTDANSWTYIGTVEELISTHDATYTLINDQSGLSVAIGTAPLVSGASSSIQGVAFALSALDSIAGLAGATNAVEAWQRNTNTWYIGVVYDVAPFFSILEWNGDALSVKSTAGVGLITGQGNAISSWPSRTVVSDRIIAIGHNTAPFLTLLRWDDSAQAIIGEDTPALAPQGNTLDLVHWTNPRVSTVTIAVANVVDVEFYSYSERESNLSFKGSPTIPIPELTAITSISIPQEFRKRTVNTNLDVEDTSVFITQAQAFGADVLSWLWIDSSNADEDVADDDFSLTDDTTDIIVWNDREGDASEHLILIAYSSGSELRVLRTSHEKGSILSQATINSAGTSTAVDSWSTEVVASRLIASTYITTARVDLLTWNEQALGTVATLGLATSPTHLTSWKEPADTVVAAVESQILAISCGSCNGVSIVRASVSLEEIIVREEGLDFIETFAAQVGLDSVAAAGIVILLSFVGIYIIEGNLIGSGLVTSGLLIYFLVTGLIGFWVAIPIVFLGLFALYSRYRGAWE